MTRIHWLKQTLSFDLLPFQPVKHFSYDHTISTYFSSSCILYFWVSFLVPSFLHAFTCVTQNTYFHYFDLGAKISWPKTWSVTMWGSKLQHAYHFHLPCKIPIISHFFTHHQHLSFHYCALQLSTIKKTLKMQYLHALFFAKLTDSPAVGTATYSILWWCWREGGWQTQVWRVHALLVGLPWQSHLQGGKFPRLGEACPHGRVLDWATSKKADKKQY